MKPRLLVPTLTVVASILALLLSGCGGNKGTTSKQGSTNPPNKSVSGDITYTGNISPTHQVIIIIFRPGDQSPYYSTVISKPGPYTISNVADSTYKIYAFMDLGDDMGPPQPNEPVGYYNSNGSSQSADFIMSGGVGLTGIDITLLDPK